MVITPAWFQENGQENQGYPENPENQSIQKIKKIKNIKKIKSSTFLIFLKSFLDFHDFLDFNDFFERYSDIDLQTLGHVCTNFHELCSFFWRAMNIKNLRQL